MLPFDARAPSAEMLQKYLAAVLVAGFFLAGEGKLIYSGVLRQPHSQTAHIKENYSSWLLQAQSLAVVYRILKLHATLIGDENESDSCHGNHVPACTQQHRNYVFSTPGGAG